MVISYLYTQLETTNVTRKRKISSQQAFKRHCFTRSSELRQAVNDDIERFFKRSVSLKVKKEMAEDPARLEQMVLALAESIGAENFAALFEVEQSLTPTKAFTETSCQLHAEMRATLRTSGVKQVVAMAAKYVQADDDVGGRVVWHQLPGIDNVQRVIAHQGRLRQAVFQMRDGESPTLF